MRKNDCSPFLSFQVMPFLLIFQVSPKKMCTPNILVNIWGIFVKLYMNVYQIKTMCRVHCFLFIHLSILSYGPLIMFLAYFV